MVTCKAGPQSAEENDVALLNFLSQMSMKACLRLASYVVSMAIHDDPPISEDVPALPVSRPSFRTRSWPASKKLWKSQLVCISDKFCRHWITFPAQTWSISIWTGIVVSRSGVPTASAGQPEGGWVTWQGGLRWPSILWFWGRVWNSDLQRSQEVTKRNCHLFLSVPLWSKASRLSRMTL